MRNREQKCLEKRKEKEEEKNLRILNAKKKIEEKEGISRIAFSFVNTS